MNDDARNHEREQMNHLENPDVCSNIKSLKPTSYFMHQQIHH
jgi:hypothetical protein